MLWIPMFKNLLNLPRLIITLPLLWTLLLYLTDVEGFMTDSVDLKYWKCILKKGSVCPDKDIRVYLYSSEHGTKTRINILKSNSLKYAGWDPHKRNVIIIHGFNQSESQSPMTIIRDAYIRRRDYNVFMLDFADLAPFPCYLSSLSNTRLVAQCAAQFYSHLTHHGASAYDIHCVGHSLGAHICGMMSNHLTHRMHKIIGIDPARPLVDRYGDKAFRLTRDDANFVQVIHTNAWFLGEAPQVGHVDFCVNGGRMQPSCTKEGRMIRRARCSHFMGACFFAATVSERGRRHQGHPCSLSCTGRLGPGTVSMGEHTPIGTQGTFCLRMRDNLGCPFD
ncbi:phospholipase A1-like [Diaphorina citri]|uniref:Phospholipase A1-like n=1 Tax=Diaphorina citri TaxID=121845 RepID=A0A1S3DUB1_DIACI|nr:phospholipase A1-like [Diaphorina citri]XP_008488112.1 phospholipase A1-like [Diaphorina citri]